MSYFRLFGIALFVMMVGSVAEAAPAGPIPIKNQHPFYVALLLQSPEEATIAQSSSVSFELDHSNIFLFSSSTDWSASIDKELTQGTITVRYPVSKRLEIGVGLPLLLSGSGALDGIIRWWHTRFGLVSYEGQVAASDFRFYDTLYYVDEPFYQGRDGELGVGDISVAAKYEVLRLPKMVTSLQFTVEAPTGDIQRGNGSGSWDVAGRLLTLHDFTPFFLHTGLGVTLPGKRRGINDTITLDPFIVGFISLEWAYSDSLSFFSQSNFNSSPDSNSALYQVSRNYVDISFGVSYKTDDESVWRFGFAENLNRTAPDFTVHLSVSMPVSFGE